MGPSHPLDRRPETTGGPVAAGGETGLAGEFEQDKPTRPLTGWTGRVVSTVAVAVGLLVIWQVLFPLAAGSQYYLIIFLGGVLPLVFLSYPSRIPSLRWWRTPPPQPPRPTPADATADGAGHVTVVDWALALLAAAVCLYPVLPFVRGGFNGFLDRQGLLDPIDIADGRGAAAADLGGLPADHRLGAARVCLAVPGLRLLRRLPCRRTGRSPTPDWTSTRSSTRCTTRAAASTAPRWTSPPRTSCCSPSTGRCSSAPGPARSSSSCRCRRSDALAAPPGAPRSRPASCSEPSPARAPRPPSASARSPGRSCDAPATPPRRPAGCSPRPASGRSCPRRPWARPAFIIAELLDVSYLQVLVWATVPTLLYYLGILLAVEIDARRFAHPGGPGPDRGVGPWAAAGAVRLSPAVAGADRAVPAGRAKRHPRGHLRHAHHGAAVLPRPTPPADPADGPWPPSTPGSAGCYRWPRSAPRPGSSPRSPPKPVSGRRPPPLIVSGARDLGDQPHRWCRADRRLRRGRPVPAGPGGTGHRLVHHRLGHHRPGPARPGRRRSGRRDVRLLLRGAVRDHAADGTGGGGRRRGHRRPSHSRRCGRHCATPCRHTWCRWPSCSPPPGRACSASGGPARVGYALAASALSVAALSVAAGGWLLGVGPAGRTERISAAPRRAGPALARPDRHPGRRRDRRHRPGGRPAAPPPGQTSDTKGDPMTQPLGRALTTTAVLALALAIAGCGGRQTQQTTDTATSVTCAVSTADPDQHRHRQHHRRLLHPGQRLRRTALSGHRRQAQGHRGRDRRLRAEHPATRGGPVPGGVLAVRHRHRRRQRHGQLPPHPQPVQALARIYDNYTQVRRPRRLRHQLGRRHEGQAHLHRVAEIWHRGHRQPAAGGRWPQPRHRHHRPAPRPHQDHRRHEGRQHRRPVLVRRPAHRRGHRPVHHPGRPGSSSSTSPRSWPEMQQINPAYQPATIPATTYHTPADVPTIVRAQRAAGPRRHGRQPSPAC